jgi:hypothetical protein
MAFFKAHSLLKGWTLEMWQKLDFQMNLRLNYIIAAANIAGDLLEPAWIREPRKQFTFGGGKFMVWGCIKYGGVREICRVEGNINSLKYQEVLATSCIPKHKRGQILQNGMKEEAWKTKPKNLDELWDVRLLPLLFLMTSSINCMNHCRTAWMQSFKLKHWGLFFSLNTHQNHTDHCINLTPHT